MTSLADDDDDDLYYVQFSSTLWLKISIFYQNMFVNKSELVIDSTG